MAANDPTRTVHNEQAVQDWLDRQALNLDPPKKPAARKAPAKKAPAKKAPAKKRARR